jgi:hypothetical protein
MAAAEEDKMSLAGFQSERRTIDALPMRIDYQSPRYEHFLRPKESDWLLSFALIKGQYNQGEIRPTTNLDPYAIRKAFEAVETAEGAVRFLSEAGEFWPWQTVLWSQFQEWQEFLSWLRVDRREAILTPRGKKAWRTAEGHEDGFFTGTDKDFTRERFRGAKMPSLALRENERQDHSTLWNLRRFALFAGTAGIDSRLSLSWYDPSDKHAPEDGQSRRKVASKRTGTRLEPFLRLEARNVLEAVAATIYLDRAHRLRHGKCKYCGRLFEIQSDHGQQFCPPPARLNSSPCKNAYLQKERRDNEKNAIAFLLKNGGLAESEIEATALAKGIRLTPAARAKAKLKL